MRGDTILKKIVYALRIASIICAGAWFYVNYVSFLLFSMLNIADVVTPKFRVTSASVIPKSLICKALGDVVSEWDNLLI